MCNDWLKDNIWLWSVCRITKDEHKQDRLPRGSNEYTINQKMNFAHYRDAKIQVEEYK